MSEVLRNRLVRIYCQGAAFLRLSPGFLSALTAAFDIELVSADLMAGGSKEPMIWFGECSETELAGCEAGRVFIVPVVEPAGGVEIRELKIRQNLPGKSWMKGKRLTLAVPQRIIPLRAESGAVMMAAEEGAVWLREANGRRIVDRVALPLPIPEDGKAVFEWFNAGSFACWLPLVQFVREVKGEHEWESTIRACFMFDDPNLHATKYGFLDYAAVAEQGRDHGYHAAFATIPLDGWYVSKRAACLLREHREVISLLVHGNDHVHRELAQPYDQGAREMLLAQALRRIARLEAVSGVDVCRVMAAPHGACSEKMLGSMAQFGFEAASISFGSLKHHNEGRPWVFRLGSRPAEIIAGLPVVPRFPMATDISQQATLAAFLDQPIIPMGHHGDVAGGLELLSDMAEQIKQLGPVKWMRMGEICRTHFQSRLDNGTLCVRPYTRHFQLSVPQGAEHLRLVPLDSDDCRPTRYLKCSGDGQASEFAPDELVKVEAGELLSIKAVEGNPLNPERISAPGWKLRPVLRRLACEARERIRPVLHRG